MCETQKRIDKARWFLLTKQPFYGSLAMAMADVLDPTIPTACTDGKVIRWNPEFVAELSDAELRFALLHETLHAAHGHMWRLPTDSTGNEAGDYAINLTIADLDDISMPDGLLFDKKYAGMSEEEIYAKLSAKPKKQPQDGQGGGDGDGGDQQPSSGGQQPSSGGAGGKKQKSKQPSSLDDGDGDDDGGVSNETGHEHGKGDNPCSHFAPYQNPDADQAQQDVENAKLRDEWEQRVIQASQAAQAMGGETPGDMERLLERMRHQSVDWRREMADFLKSALATRNDWSRSARRHAWQRVIYPRRVVDSVGTVLFARDSSGSVTDKIAAEFTGLISDCVSEMNCEGVVVDCDAEIKAEHRIGPGEECPARMLGGGGTRFQPVFDRAAELVASGEQIAGIVYLTDMYCFDKPVDPDIPTLWVSTTDEKPSWLFGRVTRVEVDR